MEPGQELNQSVQFMYYTCTNDTVFIPFRIGSLTGAQSTSFPGWAIAVIILVILVVGVIVSAVVVLVCMRKSRGIWKGKCAWDCIVQGEIFISIMYS